MSSVCTEEILFLEFAKFGSVLQAQIRRNQKGFSLGYGFVKMGSIKEADNATAALDGVILAGRNISVKDAASGEKYNNHFKHSYSLYIKFESIISGKRTNEVILRQIFEKYGEIIDVTIRRCEIHVIYSYKLYIIYTNNNIAK